MSVVEFPQKAATRRVTDSELQAIRVQAEMNYLLLCTKAWADVVAALDELKDRRWEESRRGQ